MYVRAAPPPRSRGRRRCRWTASAGQGSRGGASGDTSGVGLPLRLPRGQLELRVGVVRRPTALGSERRPTSASTTAAARASFHAARTRAGASRPARTARDGDHPGAARAGGIRPVAARKTRFVLPCAAAAAPKEGARAAIGTWQAFIRRLLSHIAARTASKLHAADETGQPSRRSP